MTNEATSLCFGVRELVKPPVLPTTSQVAGTPPALGASCGPGRKQWHALRDAESVKDNTHLPSAYWALELILVLAVDVKLPFSCYKQCPAITEESKGTYKVKSSPAYPEITRVNLT